MYYTCTPSSISLRTRGLLSFPFDEYSHCSVDTHPFAYSSSRTCCSCCGDSIYKVPISPSYCYSFYGLRQSSLIQWSPYRKLISGGFDRCSYARLPVCDVDRSCYCEKVCNFRDKNVGRRKVALRKCRVFEERSEMYDDGIFDEAEVILSLLTEDVDEECVRVTKETRRLSKKLVLEKRFNGEVSNTYDCKKKRDNGEVSTRGDSKKKRDNGEVSTRRDSKKKRDNGEVSTRCDSEMKEVDLAENEHRCECGAIITSKKKDNRRREEIILSEEEDEALLREENRKLTKKKDNRRREEIVLRGEEDEALLREENRKQMLQERRARVKEEREALLRKESQNDEGKQEGGPKLGKENLELSSRTEEREDLLRREDHRQKVRRDGSSCSSYYSLSSIGDYESDIEIEPREGRVVGAREYQRHEDHREDRMISLTKNSISKELSAGASAVEPDFRKKSEKKLADVSVGEMGSRKETTKRNSKFPMASQSNYEKSSDYYVGYDDREVKSTGSTKLSEQQLRQTADEVSGQSETRLKYKKFTEVQDTGTDDIRNSYGSQKVYSGKDEMSSKVASSSQQTVGEHGAAVGISTIENEYQSNSIKVSEVSQIQDIDIRNASISNVANYTTNIVVNSINDAVKQQQQYDQARGLVESRAKSEELTKRKGKSILTRESDKLKKQEENVNLAYGSSLESTELCSQTHAKIIRREDSGNEYNELSKISHIHSGDSGAIVEDRNKTKSETLVIPPCYSPKTGALSLGTTVEITTNEVGDGSSQSGSTALDGRKLVKSPVYHHAVDGRSGSNKADEHPSRFMSHGDTIGSAARLQESSAHYLGEFVHQVTSEILSSKTQRGKTTEEAKLALEEQHQRENVDSHQKKHEARHDDRLSGTSGPSDDMWNVDEPSVQEPSKAEAQDNASKAGEVVVKRTGRSLWNIISYIVRLRWSRQSENHSSRRITGGKSSPNQSNSSETWFSDHEAEENEEEKEMRNSIQGLSGSQQEEKSRVQVEEGSSSLTSEGHLQHVETNAPSSSGVLKRASPSTPFVPIVDSSTPSRGSPPISSSPRTSSAAIVDSSIPSPASWVRISPARRGVSETEVKTSDSSRSEQLNTGLVDQTGSAVSEGELKGRKLQRIDRVPKDRFDEWEEAYRLEAEQRKVDEMFMREALLEAQKAADNWEVPVGAVLVHNGKVIARGFNLVEELRDSTAHAEMICIREASSLLRTWRLSETTLYVTLEPCPMCAGAILQARIDSVVWGAPNKLLGADGSWIRLFPNGDGGIGLEQTDKPPAPVHPFHPKITVRRGVLATECADSMQQFFKLRRKEDNIKRSASCPPSASSSAPTSASAPTPASSLPPCLPMVPRRSRFFSKLHNVFNFLFCL